MKIKKVIDVSTDKAADPINLYGLTKAVGEKLMIQANQLNTDTQFVCIRSGNVLGTNGSVLPLFKNRIKQGLDLTLTSSAMTRFFLTISQAIDLLLKAAAVSLGGEIFVIRMKTCKIKDLATVLIRRMASSSINIKEVGIRPGEKLHEVLITKHEATSTHHYEKNHFVILSTHPSDSIKERYLHLPRVTFDTYHSNMNLMSLDEIEEILVEGGFLP